MNNIKRKGVLLAISILLLVAAGIYMTVGWFTKMTSVSSLEFDVARWDFTADYQITDFTLNVYNYTNVLKDKAAPGTAGEIPVLLSAGEAETDVYYQFFVDKSTMSPEFQERIYFYSDKAMTELLTEADPVKGTIPFGGEEQVKIYWKWIYDFKDLEAMSNADGKTTLDGCNRIENETSESFDQFDTEVGKRPDLYEVQMCAQLKISGLQSRPTPATPAPTPAEPEVTG